MIRNRMNEFLSEYGLGIIFAGNVVGAGSVYILAETGASHGFALLWVLPLALLVDMVMHDMSARLATIDKPVMEFLREKMGRSTIFLSLGIAFIMQFWGVANYAVAGAALAWLLPPLDNVFIGILVGAGIGISLVQLKLYDRIEAAITALIMVVFGSYIVLMLGLDLPVSEISAGLVPAIKMEVSYLTGIIALLGTTVYYPNFLIQSSIYETKGWDNIRKWRKDNAVGVTTAVALSIAVMIVSAITLRSTEMALTTPGEPLDSILGGWALTVFVIAVFCASFTSATGTLFAAGYIVPQSFGKKVKFGDWRFRTTVVSLISLSAFLAIFVLSTTGFTPVWLAITMPAINGLIGLPITVFALWWAVNEYLEPTLKENIVFGLTALILLGGSLLTAQSLYQTIMSLI